MLKVTGLELQKVTRPIKNQAPFKSIKTHKNQLETQKKQF